MRLAKRLREWRLQAGLTQRDLARLLRKPHSFVYKIETRNRRLDPIEFSRWVKACGVQAQEAVAALGLD